MVFIIVLLVSVLVQIIAPWYFIVPVAFGAALLTGKTARGSFFQALLAIALLWGVLASYLHVVGEGIITSRVAGMFSLPMPELMIVVTMLTGGLVAGMAALSGYYTRKVIKRGTWQFR
jgi:hypothetical protein